MRGSKKERERERESVCMCLRENKYGKPVYVCVCGGKIWHVTASKV